MKFWQTTWQLEQGKQHPIHMVSSVTGEILNSIEGRVRQWKEYFKDLLNSTNMHSVEEEESKDSLMGSVIM